MRFAALALLAISLAACAGPKNPSFPLTLSEAKQDLRRMKEDPKPTERPVVILAGWGDPGFADKHLFNAIDPRLESEQILRVTFSGANTFDAARQRVIEMVDEAFPSDDPDWTTEVDVIANSMGGLIARYASDSDAGARTLKIHRLFALASPFQGANAAQLPVPVEIVKEMREGSEFLDYINSDDRDYDYTLIPYVRLGDTYVGVKNTAPPGETPYWVPARPFSPSHLMAFKDPRFKADILRHLRGEEPFTADEPAPLPSEVREQERTRYGPPWWLKNDRGATGFCR